MLAEPERFGRAETGEVEADEEVAQVPTTVETAHAGHRGEQFARLNRIDRHAPIQDLPDLRRLPRLHLVDFHTRTLPSVLPVMKTGVPSPRLATSMSMTPE